MHDVVIRVENVSKLYRLGQVGRKTLGQDINRRWYRARGKEDPYMQIGESNDRTKSGDANNAYVWALRDINFDVERGEVLGLIGRNGAGKSTMLKILSRITSPTTGSIKIKGRIASLLEVGTGFHPELSGRDNIFLNGAILGMTRKEVQSKFDEIVDFAGVARYIDTPVKRYSSGMYVRLAFAVAAHLEPDILIVDEVLAVGDVEFQKKCIGKIKDVSTKEGRTVLFVSHNIPAILNLCDKAIVLEWGRIISQSKTDEAINFYLRQKTSSASIDILKRADRQGNGLIKCQGIFFLNKYHEEVASVKSGDEIFICIDFSLKTVSVRSVYFRIQIITPNETILFVCNNEHTNETYALIDKSGIAICHIPKFPLFGGIYFINVQIFSREKGLLDEVEFAKELNVEDGDFFETGRIPVIKKGILVSHDWQLKFS